MTRREAAIAFWLAGATATAACDRGITVPIDAGSCLIPPAAIVDGGPGRDGIPALTNPELVGANDPGADYLRPDDRVIVAFVAGQAVAVPLNIGWWHEIVNLDMGGLRLAITHCPLTGSSLAFDRSAAGGAEFGVSGLLFETNMIMYDRRAQESLWPQMMRGAACGQATGTPLAMHPVIEVRWGAWAEMEPATLVVSSETGILRDYRLYPYFDYDELDNDFLLFSVSRVDRRRPLKERVLGVPDEQGGIAFSFGALAELGTRAVVHEHAGGAPVVVFWDQDAESAMAYRPELDGSPVTFRVEDGRVVDSATGSTWRVDGLAVEGPAAGQRLTPVAEAYIAFWFAWAVFHPETILWTGGES